MSKLQDFLHEKLQESLAHDEPEDDEESWEGGIVTAWVVIVAVMPPPHVDDRPHLLALAAEGQRSWETKGMLMDAMDMERREAL